MYAEASRLLGQAGYEHYEVGGWVGGWVGPLASDGVNARVIQLLGGWECLLLHSA